MRGCINKRMACVYAISPGVGLVKISLCRPRIPRETETTVTKVKSRPTSPATTSKTEYAPSSTHIYNLASKLEHLLAAHPYIWPTSNLYTASSTSHVQTQISPSTWGQLSSYSGRLLINQLWSLIPKMTLIPHLKPSREAVLCARPLSSRGFQGLHFGTALKAPNPGLLRSLISNGFLRSKKTT